MRATNVDICVRASLVRRVDLCSQPTLNRTKYARGPFLAHPWTAPAPGSPHEPLSTPRWLTQPRKLSASRLYKSPLPVSLFLLLFPPYPHLPNCSPATTVLANNNNSYYEHCMCPASFPHSSAHCSSQFIMKICSKNTLVFTKFFNINKKKVRRRSHRYSLASV